MKKAYGQTSVQIQMLHQTSKNLENVVTRILSGVNFKMNFNQVVVE